MSHVKLLLRHVSLLLFVCCSFSGIAQEITEKGFLPVWLDVKKPEYIALQKELQAGRVLEEMAQGLNETFKLDTHIIMTFAECDQANAFYAPNEQTIIMCYELMDHFSELFADQVANEDELGEAVGGATIFTFFHEVGHALVHVLDLPVTGKEEDAVDQLAATILLDETDEFGTMASLAAAMWFGIEGERMAASGAKISDLPFYDQHAMSSARFHNIICWIYGSNPEMFKDFAGSEWLPAGRAVTCKDEFDRFSRAWEKMLTRHFREAAPAKMP